MSGFFSGGYGKLLPKTLPVVLSIAVYPIYKSISKPTGVQHAGSPCFLRCYLVQPSAATWEVGAIVFDFVEICNGCSTIKKNALHPNNHTMQHNTIQYNNNRIE